MKVIVFVGTRPEIIKMSPIVRSLSARPGVDLMLVHSGQHYDFTMSQIFIDQLRMPQPGINIGTGSGSHAEQTSRIMVGAEKVINRSRPDVVMAEGDTNTVAAVGMVCAKSKVPFAHVEAGLRSFDMRMPEEINRIVADHCATLCFAPTEISATNLMRESILLSNIEITGNTIVDACRFNLPLAEHYSIVREKLDSDVLDEFCLMTVHRAENVDDPRVLHKLVSLIRKVRYHVLYPVHPRSRSQLIRNGLWRVLAKQKNVTLLPPLGYWDFLWLLARSKIVMTDSGGVQEEALTLGVPCITLRDNTERPETVIAGNNTVTGMNVARVMSAIDRTAKNLQRRQIKNPLGDGRAGQRIARILATRIKKELEIQHSRFLRDGYQSRLLIRRLNLQIGSRKFPRNTSLAYDTSGALRFPKRVQKTTGWSVEISGEPSDLRKQLSRRHAIYR